MKIFITGAAGYVGAMLVDQFSKRPDVDEIIGIDKERLPEFLKGNTKLTWIDGNIADDVWQKILEEKKPEVMIHCAWQIREMYGKKGTQWKWNVEGSLKIFDFAFSHDFVKKLIYFSTVSSYGAESTNTLEYRFKESDPFIENEYLYGVEKRVVEERLKEKFDMKKKEGKSLPQVFIVRPAAITGPRGRFMMKERFGLQAALSGKLSKSPLHRLISLMVSFVPAPPLWLRQFIHEDDVANIVEMFAFKQLDGEYEVFNICPPGDPVLAVDMAKAVGKKVLPIPPFMIRIAFFFFWHSTRGRVPTSKGGWKFYSFPIAVDGSRLTERYGYQYQWNSKDAFVFTDGRYGAEVPEGERKTKKQ
ncbi:MAG: hypothetical protein A2408_00855 [Candidatus Yonathbacteria bacterium RIFOXYC1_FULL_52_10]|uniref:NAD-dependent epimerase/dehydratase domain-containing protein n=1 Tax=Candidatus Yonathbacteria bacterium RIFOXYD1_FULL_52_36 TaxID=1802730 RepID=A0A1G2SJD8_9BACT|nr:MAG: hypothetical protein A2591_04070 [Candidatus Yonathbacteria bacterium RIFOXYD1_FULL_52_36]OHA85694.1 MAG: hypothetical protein A2408_00855 [Candidatus Yonathbacteria bacterium RIFOXYC1_FULL_52_10]